MKTVFTVHATFRDGVERRVNVTTSKWDAENTAETYQRRGMTTRTEETP